MSDHHVGNADDDEAADGRDPSPGRGPEPEGAGKNPGRRVARAAETAPSAPGAPAPGLLVPVSRAAWEDFDPSGRSGSRPRRDRRWAVAIGSLALAALAVTATALIAVDRHRQSALLAEGARETTTLAETVSALNARLQAVEATRGHDEFAELRRSVGEMKATAASSRELGAAITQLSQRVEKLDREQGAKLDRLGQKVGEEATAARVAEVAARLDRLEKKPAAPQPAPPRFTADVAMEPTGSIGRPRPTVRGYVVLGAQNDIAIIGGRYGERAVRTGDFVPGAGRVQRVERQGPNWVVVTDQGVIPSAYSAPD